MNISKALEVDGWMNEQELTWLADQASKHHTIVEIGSFLGRSTRALADNTEGTVYAVDYWLGPTEICMAPWDREQLYDHFCENLSDLIDSKKVIPIKCNSHKVELDVVPDMVFIDGDHAYDSVVADIKKWRHLDFVCGHDYSWSTVKQAVSELLPGAQSIEGTDIWCWNRKHEAN